MAMDRMNDVNTKSCDMMSWRRPKSVVLGVDTQLRCLKTAIQNGTLDMYWPTTSEYIQYRCWSGELTNTTMSFVYCCPRFTTMLYRSSHSSRETRYTIHHALSEDDFPAVTWKTWRPRTPFKLRHPSLVDLPRPTDLRFRSIVQVYSLK